MIHLLGGRGFWIAVALSLILAVALLRGQEPLRDRLADVKKAYELELELSRHKAEHLRSYQDILGRGSVPTEKTLPANEWIKVTQNMVAETKLSLQELKPSRDGGRNHARGGGLFLVVEGDMTELVKLLYRIATAKDLIYIKKVSISQADEGSNSVRVQMTLSQA